MSKLLTALIACFFGAMLVPFGAFADGKKDCVTGDPRCEAWLSGKGSPPGKPVTCLVLVVATQDVRVEVLRTKRLDICIGPQCPPPKKNE